jgi:putative endonuclease
MNGYFVIKIIIMAVHLELGRKGEEWAAAFLEEKGFTIVERNWRYSRYEIDLVAVRNGLLHFIEVKSRSSGRFNRPEDAVGKKKVEDLLKAVDAYLFLHPEYRDFHLDIIAIEKKTDGRPEFFLIEDVYL